MLLVAAALVALAVASARESSDRTLTGTVTARESHRVCVGQPASQDVCVRADSPQRLADISAGDCVRIRYSPEEILISIEIVDVERECSPSP